MIAGILFFLGFLATISVEVLLVEQLLKLPMWAYLPLAVTSGIVALASMVICGVGCVVCLLRAFL